MYLPLLLSLNQRPSCMQYEGGADIASRLAPAMMFDPAILPKDGGATKVGQVKLRDYGTDS